ncbi:hypothetical protein ACU8KH_03276 [Lachancea thermotolerans]
MSSKTLYSYEDGGTHRLHDFTYNAEPITPKEAGVEHRFWGWMREGQ